MSLISKTISRSSVAGVLRACGIAPTHQRMEIAYVLLSKQRHLSADQVLALVNRQHAQTSKATVYNTLKLFVEKELIREVIVNPTKVFYDPNTREHHHLYDTQSGELIDIETEEVEVKGLPPLPPGMTTEGIDIVVRIRRTSGGEPEAGVL